MGKQKLHPTIEDFKGFVKKHPKLVQEVRKGSKTWQELYEDWYLLGESDETWDKYKTEGAKKETKGKSNTDIMSKILSTIKHVDMNDVQKQITNVGSAITTIQEVIHQFKGPTQEAEKGNPLNPQRQQKQNNPFAFRKD